MKGVAFFSSRLWIYLTELPVILLLVISVRHNSAAENFGKLYPLIILLSLLIVFIAIYFFRGVIISNDEIKCVGVFSSKDSAIIKKDRTLVITTMNKKRIKLELFGDGGDDPAYEWLRDDLPSEINLFRAKAYGSTSSVKRVLFYFDVPEDDIEAATKNTQRIDAQKAFETPDSKKLVFTADYKDINLSVLMGDDCREYRILFKETI